MSKQKGRRKGPLAVIEIIIIVILVLAIALMLAVYFSFRNSGQAPKLFGYYIYHTHAVNMETDIPKESAVFAKESEIDNIIPGSVVLCNIDDTMTLIRVIEIMEEDDGTFYLVRYDTSPQNETCKIPKESVVAKAMTYDRTIGALLNFATSKKGIVVVVIIPSIVIILIQLIRILTASNDDDEDDEPDFDEDDYQGKLKALSDRQKDGTLPAVRAKFDTNAPVDEKVLTVDSSGKAEYTPKNKADSVLITGETLDAMSGKTADHNAPVVHGFANEPVKIPEEKEETAEEKGASLLKNIMETDFADTSAFAPSVSNVIPESISSIKTPANTVREPEPARASKAAPAANEPHEYFNLNDLMKAPEAPAPEEKNDPILTTNSIPEKAVVPTEKIAPVRKQSAHKTIDELMGIIDATQNKINKNK